MDENQLFDMVFERTIDQLTLDEIVQQGSSHLEVSKWRRLVERILKGMMKETLIEKKMEVLMQHVDERKSHDAFVESEKLYNENLKYQNEYNEKLSNDQKRRLIGKRQELNEKLSELKDQLEGHAEYAVRKFEYCCNYEKSLAEAFHQKFNLDQALWVEKIFNLENEIKRESSRNTEERSTLCLAIEQLSQTHGSMLKDWEESCNQLKSEKLELLQKLELMKPHINCLSKKLMERKAVVTEDQLAKKQAEEENYALIKFSMAVIRIQSWWRGVLARKDYARFKLASVKRKSKKNSGSLTQMRNK